MPFTPLHPLHFPPAQNVTEAAPGHTLYSTHWSLLCTVHICCHAQVSMLTAMGFEVDAAEAALTATGGNVERAGDWLFSHMDDLPAAIAAVKGGAAAAAAGGGGADAAAAAAGNR
jgi:hypothetical protein